MFGNTSIKLGLTHYIINALSWKNLINKIHIKVIS